MDELPVGHVIDERYRVVQKLGEANDLEVYAVEHVAMDKPLTVLLAKSAANEAGSALAAAARLESDGGPGHLECEDFGRAPDGRNYAVLKLTDDQLRDILAGTRVFGG